MKNLSVNENNDIYLTADGQLAVSTELQATLEVCASAVKAQLGEMIYAMDRGMPNAETIWNGRPNIPQFELYLRNTILGVQGVQEISSLAIQHINDILSYQVTIQTIYGSGDING